MRIGGNKLKINKKRWQLYIGIIIIGIVLIPDPSLDVQHIIKCSIYVVGAYLIAEGLEGING